jgi:hypothetical protein
MAVVSLWMKLPVRFPNQSCSCLLAGCVKTGCKAGFDETTLKFLSLKSPLERIVFSAVGKVPIEKETYGLCFICPDSMMPSYPKEIGVMAVDHQLATTDLMKLAADNHHKRIELSDDDRCELISLLKKRALEELDFGQELEHEKVRLIRRVTGAVGVYFNS